MPPPTPPSPKIFILVHGASHGGWCYDRVACLLRAQGHTVFTPTLAGVGERIAEISPAINLTTHINDILALFEREKLTDVFLCGHSYGGMVVSGVADAIPARIRNLIFLDAVVPMSGTCMNDYVFPGWKRWAVIAGVWLLGRGYNLTPPPPAWYFGVNKADRKMVESRLTAHPFNPLQEKIVLRGNADRIAGHTYIFGTQWGFGPIAEQYRQAKARAGWKTFEVAAGHDIMIDAPEELAGILGGLD